VSSETRELVIVVLTLAPWLLFIGCALCFSVAAAFEGRDVSKAELRRTGGPAKSPDREVTGARP
jgi:hypothetical protein